MKLEMSINFIWFRFLLSCLLFIMLSGAFQILLFSENLYFNAFQDQISYERIEELISQGKKWRWVGYAIIPVALLIKVSFVASCLSLGYYFNSNQLTFKSCFNSAVQAELIFLLPILLKMLWFLFVQTDYDLNDLQQFSLLSLANFFSPGELRPYWMVPLVTLNLFEVAYWFLLAYSVAKSLEMPFKRAFGLVMSSYGVGLLLWVVLLMFLFITYS